MTLNADQTVTANFETHPDFQLSVADPHWMEVKAGGAAQFALSLVSGGGFNQAVTLTCSGAPRDATCSILPARVTPQWNGRCRSDPDGDNDPALLRAGIAGDRGSQPREQMAPCVVASSGWLDAAEESSL